MGDSSRMSAHPLCQKIHGRPSEQRGAANVLCPGDAYPARLGLLRGQPAELTAGRGWLLAAQGHGQLGAPLTAPAMAT